MFVLGVISSLGLALASTIYLALGVCVPFVAVLSVVILNLVAHGFLLRWIRRIERDRPAKARG